jgi:hypothetical protein
MTPSLHNLHRGKIIFFIHEIFISSIRNLILCIWYISILSFVNFQTKINYFRYSNNQSHWTFIVKKYSNILTDVNKILKYGFIFDYFYFFDYSNLYLNLFSRVHDFTSIDDQSKTNRLFTSCKYLHNSIVY